MSIYILFCKKLQHSPPAAQGICFHLSPPPCPRKTICYLLDYASPAKQAAEGAALTIPHCAARKYRLTLNRLGQVVRDALSLLQSVAKQTKGGSRTHWDECTRVLWLYRVNTANSLLFQRSVFKCLFRLHWVNFSTRKNKPVRILLHYLNMYTCFRLIQEAEPILCIAITVLL